MVNHPLKPCARDPKPDNRELDAKRLALDQERADLVDADPLLLGMRMGNLLYAAALGLLNRVGEQ